jgi:hypothetical protein
VQQAPVRRLGALKPRRKLAARLEAFRAYASFLDLACSGGHVLPLSLVTFSSLTDLLTLLLRVRFAAR